MYKVKTNQISMLQVRLELTTSASLCRLLSYKYRALTDCATGAVEHLIFLFRSDLQYRIHVTQFRNPGRK